MDPSRPLHFFNLDLHISVIADVRAILEELGHRVTSWSLSGHNWVFERPPSKVDVVSAQNWRSLDRRMCDAFYERYKDELSGYDGFIVTYPPSFALLFERFEKPVIIQAPIRYEVPFSHRPELWRAFDDHLRAGIDAGRIIALANSRYDAKYAEHFTRRPWTHVPSLCEYTGVRYAPTKPWFLWYSRVRALPPALSGVSIPSLVLKDGALPQGYKWADLVAFRGLVGVPYNISTMSIFEHYAQGLPMWFPSEAFMLAMRQAAPAQVLGEVTWNQTLGLPPGSSVGTGEDDPNRYDSLEVLARWLPLADFYDREWMPHLRYFSSMADLRDQLAGASDEDLRATSHAMLDHGKVRRARVLDLWRGVVDRVRAFSGARR